MSIDNFSSNQLLAYLQHPQLTIYRSEITIFELSAIGSKYIRDHILDIEDLTTGLNTLLFAKNIHVIPIYLSGIQILAHHLHESHSDFIDCLILASAAAFTEMMLTEDRVLLEKSRTLWHDVLLSINPLFQLTTVSQFQSKFAP